jgi:hypothetical protein
MPCLCFCSLCSISPFVVLFSLFSPVCVYVRVCAFLLKLCNHQKDVLMRALQQAGVELQGPGDANDRTWIAWLALVKWVLASLFVSSAF